MASAYSIYQIGAAKVALNEIPHARSVCIGIWFKAGGRYEPVGMHGGAHFIEHMLFKGTRRRTSFRINQEIESRGGDLNAFTSEEFSCYYSRISSEHGLVALDVLLDMVFGSIFPKGEVEHERSVIQEEIRMYEDQPSSVAVDHLNTLLWPNQTLGRILTGSVESVGGIKRAELLAFWRSHYHTGNVLIAISGCVDKGRWLDILGKKLRYCRGQKEAALIRRARHLSGRKMSKVYLKKNFQQINLSVGCAAYSRHDVGRFPLRVLSVLLGENSCSRIFQSLREKHGLVYSVNTSIAQFQDTGAFYIQAGLEAGNYPAAIRLVRKELVAILNKTVSPQELKRAKDFAIGQLHLNLESPMHQVMWMGEGFWGDGKVPEADEWCKAISRVTASEVQAVAREIIRPGRMALVCVGNELDEKIFNRENLL